MYCKEFSLYTKPNVNNLKEKNYIFNCNYNRLIFNVALHLPFYFYWHWENKHFLFQQKVGPKLLCHHQLLKEIPSHFFFFFLYNYSVLHSQNTKGTRRVVFLLPPPSPPVIFTPSKFQLVGRKKKKDLHIPGHFFQKAPKNEYD